MERFHNLAWGKQYLFAPNAVRTLHVSVFHSITVSTFLSKKAHWSNYNLEVIRNIWHYKNSF